MEEIKIYRVPVGVAGFCAVWQGNGEAGKTKNATLVEVDMSGMTCDVNGCIWNDGSGGCGCDGIYISDTETGEPKCESAEFPED